MQQKAKQLSKIFLTCMEVSVLRGFLRLLKVMPLTHRKWKSSSQAQLKTSCFLLTYSTIYILGYLVPNFALFVFENRLL